MSKLKECATCGLLTESPRQCSECAASLCQGCANLSGYGMCFVCLSLYVLENDGAWIGRDAVVELAPRFRNRERNKTEQYR